MPGSIDLDGIEIAINRLINCHVLLVPVSIPKQESGLHADMQLHVLQGTSLCEHHYVISSVNA